VEGWGGRGKRAGTMERGGPGGRGSSGRRGHERRRGRRRGCKQFYGQHSLSMVVPTVSVPKAALPGWKRVVKGCATTLYNALTRNHPSLGAASRSRPLSSRLPPPLFLSLVGRASSHQARYILTAAIKGTDALTRATITAKTNIFRESGGF